MGIFMLQTNHLRPIFDRPLKDSLNKILKLQGVSFNWRDTGEPSIGLIAQDVEKVFPEVVFGKEGEKTIDYAKLIAPLIEALKEQQKEIEELKAEIEQLKLKIKYGANASLFCLKF